MSLTQRWARPWKRRREAIRIRDLLDVTAALLRDKRSAHPDEGAQVGDPWQDLLHDLRPPRPPRDRQRVVVGARRRRPRIAWVPVATVLAVLALFGRSLLSTAVTPAVASTPFYTADCADLKVKNPSREVVVAAVWADEERARFGRVLQRFFEETRVRVKFATEDGGPNRDLGATVRDLVRRGCPPDVVLLPQPGLLRELARERSLVPIEAIAGQLVSDNYVGIWREMASYGDELYGVWFKANNKSMLWYDASVFARVGITQVPEDWEQLLNVAGRLAAAGVAPFAIGGDPGWTVTDLFENIYLRLAGSAKYGALARNEVPWTDQSVVDTLERMKQLLSPSGWVVRGLDEAASMTYEDSVHQVFGEGEGPRAAMMFGSTDVQNEIATAPARLGADAKNSEFPAIEGSSSAVVAGDLAGRGEVGGDVAVLLRNTPAAEKLIRYLATPEAAESWAREGGFLSPNKRLDPSVYPDDRTREAAAALVSPETRFDLSDLLPAEYGSTRGQGMWKVMQDFIRNPSDPSGTARTLETELCRTVGRSVVPRCPV